MYKLILLNRNLSKKEQFKRLVAYYFKKRGARIPWRKVFKKRFVMHPILKTPDDKSIEKAHIHYWRQFSNHINLSTLRICKNISGISNYKFIPEEIFKCDIEPTLNTTSCAKYLSYKSFYNRWFPNNIFPNDILHNIDGEWLNKDLNPITFNDVKSLAQNLNYPVVLKPTRDSSGGKNIHFPEAEEEFLDLIMKLKDFIVQEKVYQHTYFKQFNPSGLNTLRVYVYRSVADNKLHVLNITLRMGVGGSLDNVSDGGIYTLVKENGFLNGFAIDLWGKKYIKHPDTGVCFDKQIPDIEGLKRISLDVAHKIFYSRLVGLDLYYDTEAKWRLIEINNSAASICFAQEQGILFFGEFSDEVFNYCRLNHWALKSPKNTL